MDIITDDEEIVKLLDVKDIEIIGPDDLLENNENDKNIENKNQTDESYTEDNSHKNYEVVESCTERRSDEPTELSFEKGDESQKKMSYNIYVLRFIFSYSLFYSNMEQW